MRRNQLLPDEFFPIVLVGLPGSGKTTVSRELARLLGVVEVDTDAEIKRRTRKSIQQLFSQEGEEKFREIEHQAVRHNLSLSRGVLALGGGAIVHEGTRELLRDELVIYLSTTPEEAAARIGSGSGRPLITGTNSVERMRELQEQRHGFYEEVATLSIATDAISPIEVAVRAFEALHRLAGKGTPRRTSAVIEASGTRRIHVGGDLPYDVVVGRDLSDEVGDSLRLVTRRIALLHPQTLRSQAQQLISKLTNKNRRIISIEVPDAEAAKDLGVLGKVWQRLGEEHFTREDAIIGLGGGATTDLAGFSAATWLRGIDFYNVPTTVLGMVDAAIGGKTGLNTGLGKNLVGAFYPPRGVFCDLNYLATLPPAEITAGLGEVIKCGFIADPKILQLFDDHGGMAAHDPSSAVFRELVERAIVLKAKVVSEDLREAAIREILNYGHTFGHAIERCENYQVRHGNAVAIGMVFAAEVALHLGMCDESLVSLHRKRIQAAGLPICYDGAPWEDLLDAMRSDKKVRSNEIRMVVLSELGVPKVVPVANLELLKECALRVRTA